MKYYYEDPLAAMWMQQTFGVHYTSEVPAIVESWGARKLHTIKTRFYVHQDSYIVFEPEIDDLIYLFGAEELNYVIDNASYIHMEDDDRTGYYALNMAKTAHAEWDVKIIQRNDKPFMWPDYINCPSR